MYLSNGSISKRGERTCTLHVLVALCIVQESQEICNRQENSYVNMSYRYISVVDAKLLDNSVAQIYHHVCDNFKYSKGMDAMPLCNQNKSNIGRLSHFTL